MVPSQVAPPPPPIGSRLTVTGSGKAAPLKREATSAGSRWTAMVLLPEANSAGPCTQGGTQSNVVRSGDRQFWQGWALPVSPDRKSA